ncbi:MAG TPA: YkgJ family cysteine cluster protein [Patescibacteria group bacterium]|nr:YkgJ family cysteine cluster protein [Patescibacteria group bacterium]
MTGETSFHCLRCGKCCRNLLAEDQGITRGLTLLSDEKAHFPESMVKPAAGVGRSPSGEGFKVTAHQLTLDDCPHLEDGLCTIYDDRPASCRQFPFALRIGPDGGVQVGLDLNCPSLVSLLEGSELRMRFEERPHAEKLLRVQLETEAHPDRSWFYDLATGRWVRLGELTD